MNSQVDKCSFRGPIARIIHFGEYTTSFADLFLSGCKYHESVGKYKSYHCKKSTNDCSYCASNEAKAGTLLEKSGGSLKRCEFSGVKTWCPASLEWTKTHLANLYGNGWHTLDKTQRNADGGH